MSFFSRIVVCITLTLTFGCAQEEQLASVEETKQVNPMKDFGTTAGNVFLYYEDLDRATKFYTETLGMKLVLDYGFAKMVQASPTGFLTLVDHTKGMHSAEEPKTVALALVMDESQIDGWWEYMRKQDVEFLHEYSPKEGRAHNAFVVVDPEGYYLEFEVFHEHPENEKLMPILNATESVYPDPEQKHTVPDGLGFKTLVVWGYYKDMAGIKAFYENVIGMEMIVDQGWTYIYPSSPSTYIGLVDESRGMHKFTEDKGVTISFFTDNIAGWYEYLSSENRIKMKSESLSEEENGRFTAFVGYDPANYYLEFDQFNEMPDNTRLIKALEETK
ncbi:MAG: VOC family protein [Candidatus Latescibacteria bacterium]|jgi:catechol 2,3-dioxygenase-like lactoylglutathione lyase family enzyme|nr:VOC family protein [Candidatus Latescibacterota bacterium]